MNKKVLEIILNITFWILSGYLILNNFSIESFEVTVENGVEKIEVIRNNNIIRLLLVGIGISLPIFYLNYLNILHLNGLNQRYRVLLKSTLLFILGLIAYFGFFHLGLFDAKIEAPSSLTWGVYIFFFSVSTAYGFLKVWLSIDKQRHKLSIEKKNAELKLLRSQLQPHFLFNVLNNLLALVNQKESPELASSLDKLSALLRYVVYETEQGKVELVKEIEFIKNYAELQLLRFEDKELLFECNVSGEFKEQTVEPGLFIPFVENAFKYGAEPERDSVIKLDFDLNRKGEIHFRLENDVLPTMQKQKGNNSGIASSKERLELVYPEKHKLVITEDKKFIVDLRIIND